jgi:hypothetical protein
MEMSRKFPDDYKRVQCVPQEVEFGILAESWRRGI